MSGVDVGGLFALYAVLALFLAAVEGMRRSS
jgi:hypothetical protein